MFNNCSSLLSLPDISKWNTDNVTSMTSMFNNCLSLSSLPDISKWNIDNVEDMSWMFHDCSSLLIIPNFSKFERNSLYSNSNYLDFINNHNEINSSDEFEINNNDFNYTKKNKTAKNKFKNKHIKKNK